MNYVDESIRRLDENVMDETLDSDFGGEISISLSVDQFGNIITSPSGLLSGSLYDFDTTDLMQFENVYVDFVGFSRIGNERKGSSFVWHND